MTAHPLDVAVTVIDFGLVVLIWLVQAVVYPSFREIDDGGFRAWHRSYSRRVALIVVPLMLGQAALHGIRLALAPRPLAVAAAACVAVAWVATFGAAVPLHRELAASGQSESAIRSLLRVNWWRTAAWSLTFLLSARMLF